MYDKKAAKFKLYREKKKKRYDEINNKIIINEILFNRAVPNTISSRDVPRYVNSVFQTRK